MAKNATRRTSRPAARPKADDPRLAERRALERGKRNERKVQQLARDLQRAIVRTDSDLTRLYDVLDKRLEKLTTDQLSSGRNERTQGEAHAAAV